MFKSTNTWLRITRSGSAKKNMAQEILSHKGSSPGLGHLLMGGGVFKGKTETLESFTSDSDLNASKQNYRFFIVLSSTDQTKDASRNESSLKIIINRKCVIDLTWQRRGSGR